MSDNGESNARPDRKATARRPHGGDPIESNLKRAFRETLDEPLPDNLAQLLEKLKQGDAAR